MKRTKILTLAIVGTLALSACGPTAIPENTTFTSVQECTDSGVDVTTCNTALAEAKKASAEQAPRFSSQAQCEAQFGAGACNSQTGSDGNDWFMPALAGFMVGNMLSNSGSSSSYYRGREDERRRSGGVSYVPVYRSASGLSTYSGGKAASAPSTYTASRLSTSYGGSSNSAYTSARGGFGSRASASVSS